jgi:uncharacterized membrane protein YbjE (DUF340 family)
METGFIAGILVFLGATIFAARMMQNATAALSQEQRSDLFSIFNKERTMTTLILVAIIVAFAIGLQTLKNSQWLTYAYFAALVLFLGISTWRRYGILKKHGYPDAYLKPFVWSSVIRYAGLAAVVASALFWGGL